MAVEVRRGAGYDDASVVSNVGGVEGPQNFAAAPVRFHHEIPIVAETARAAPLRRRHDGRVG